MGLTKRDLLIAITSCALFVSCAATFNYRFYAYDIRNHVLLGDKPEHDLADAVCIGVNGNKYPCIVMMIDEFGQLKEDYLVTKQKLIDCEKSNPPSGISFDNK